MVTTLKQIVEDAVDVATERWEAAVLAGKVIDDLPGWSFRVGANAARRLAGRNVAVKRDGALDAAALLTDRHSSVSPAVKKTRGRVLRAVVTNRKKLIGRQFDVVTKLSEPGMSLHRAAVELGIDRTNLRRSFKAALKRLSERQD